MIPRFGVPFAPPKHQLDLTSLGRSKLESIDDMPDIRAAIMFYLKDHGRSSPQEIAKRTGKNFQKVQVVVKQLVSGDYRWIEWC